MAALPEQNDCVHRGICKFRGDGMCLTECGHYAAEEKFTSTNNKSTPCYFCGRTDGTHERGRSCNRDTALDDNMWK